MMHAPAEWREHLKPKLLLVGEGPLRSQLERITQELGIQDSVEFLGGYGEMFQISYNNHGGLSCPPAGRACLTLC